MILGKRTATDALLPTIDVRPYKRSSPNEDDDSQMSEGGRSSKSNSNWASWLVEAAGNAINSFLSLRQQPEAQEIVAQASKHIHQTLDTASTSIKEAIDQVLPPHLTSKPPVPGGPSTPIHILDTPSPSVQNSALAPSPTPNRSTHRASPFSPQKSWAPSPPSSLFKVPVSPYNKEDGGVNGWSTSSPVRPLRLVNDNSTPGPSNQAQSAPPNRREASSSFQPADSHRRDGPSSLFASTSTNRSGWAYASSAGGILSRSQGLGVRATPRHEHIHMRKHKQELAARSRKQLEELARQYEEKKAGGYGQDFKTYVQFEEYRARVEQLHQQDFLSSSTTRKLGSLRAPPGAPLPSVPISASISPRSRRVSFESPTTTSGYSPPRERMNGPFSSSIRTGVDLGSLGGRRLSTSTTTRPLFPKASELPWPKPSGSRFGPPSTDASWKSKAARGLDLEKAIEKAKAALEAPRPPLPDVPSFERLTVKDKKTDEEITRRLRRERRKKLPTRLTDSQQALVRRYLKDPGFMARVGKGEVTSKDIGRMGPGQWLNDEIINYWGALLQDRADRAKAEASNPATTGGKGKGKAAAVEDPEDPGRFGHPPPLHDIHFFNTFFYAKVQQGYDKSRLKTWTKRVDLFSKDVILIPINQGNSHWTSAAINFKKKRFECYDSLRIPRPDTLEKLRDYIAHEHMDKKKKPFDFTGWTDYCDMAMPKQENHFDCGVFVCMVLEALSRGEEVDDFVFDQNNMPYLRQRITWEFGRQKLS